MQSKFDGIIGFGGCAISRIPRSRLFALDLELLILDLGEFALRIIFISRVSFSVLVSFDCYALRALRRLCFVGGGALGDLGRRRRRDDQLGSAAAARIKCRRRRRSAASVFTRVQF